MIPEITIQMNCCVEFKGWAEEATHLGYSELLSHQNVGLCVSLLVLTRFQHLPSSSSLKQYILRSCTVALPYRLHPALSSPLPLSVTPLPLCTYRSCKLGSYILLPAYILSPQIPPVHPPEPSLNVTYLERNNLQLLDETKLCLLERDS